MEKIVIIGGGWAGCSAAIVARKQGAKVTLIEKTDLLLGAGNVGGIMRNNGRFTATEENIAMGAEELFAVTDHCATHKRVDFPGHAHASFYDVLRVEPEVRRLLAEMEVDLRFITRAVDVAVKPSADEKTGEATETTRRSIEAISVISGQAGRPINERAKREWIEGDVFVEATGSTGPMGNCMRYGNGCAMCIQRCPAFGPRVSLTERAGLHDLVGLRESGQWGAFSGSCKIEKRTLSRHLQRELKKNGFAVVPLPEQLINRGKLKEKVCQQYALDVFAENVILIDTGYAKLMSPFFNLEALRLVEGFENARIAEPYAGGQGNSVRYMSVAPREADMRAVGMENLYVAGEKAGFFVGHTEAISTGALAAYNAARKLQGRSALILPRTLAIGEMLAFGQEIADSEDGLYRRLTFAGGEFFRRMIDKGLYLTETKTVRKNVEAAGLLGVYNR